VKKGHDVVLVEMLKSDVEMLELNTFVDHVMRLALNPKHHQPTPVANELMLILDDMGFNRMIDDTRFHMDLMRRLRKWNLH